MNIDELKQKIDQYKQKYEGINKEIEELKNKSTEAYWAPQTLKAQYILSSGILSILNWQVDRFNSNRLLAEMSNEIKEIMKLQASNHEEIILGKTVIKNNGCIVESASVRLAISYMGRVELHSPCADKLISFAKEHNLKVSVDDFIKYKTAEIEKVKAIWT